MSAKGRRLPFETPKKAKSEVCMAYQFAHTNTYSRRGNKVNRSIADVVAEAVRDPKHCTHVDDPKPAILHFGISPEKIPALIDERIADAKIRFKENLKGKGCGIRQDQHMLEAAVFSHPSLSEDLVNSEDLRTDYENWRNDTIAWIKSDFERRGLDCVSIVEHLDEPHPHIHAYGLARATESNPRMDTKLCHAGHAARAAEAVPARKNRAFKQAMSNWQDQYYDSVSIRNGLLRFGPKRARETNATYKAKQQVAKNLAEMVKQTDEISDAHMHLSTAKVELEKTERQKFTLLSEIKKLRKALFDLKDVAAAELQKIYEDPYQWMLDKLSKQAGEIERLQFENEKLKIENQQLKNPSTINQELKL